MTKISGYTAGTPPIDDLSEYDVSFWDGANFLTRSFTHAEITAAVRPTELRLKPFHTLTDGATVTWDMDLGNNAIVTLDGNRTLAISNVVSGDVGVLKVIQDATTGSRTLTLPASSKVIDGGSGAITLSTATSSVDFISFVYDGTNYNWNYGLNYN